jgi:two-component system sensor histidine kinase/response regulator
MERAIKAKRSPKSGQKHAREQTRVPRVSSKVRMAQTLQESEQRYRDLFELAPIGIYKTTPDGRILVANPKLLSMLGYASFGEFAARNLEKEDIAVTPTRSQFKEMVEREGEIKSLQSTWLKRDNSLLYVSENARAIRDRDGTVLYYEGTVEDVTGRRRIEEALERRNSELALLNRAIQSLNSSLDLDQVLVMILEAVRLLLQVDSCSVWLIDQATEELVCRQCAGPNSELVRGWHLAPGQGLVGWAAQKGQSLIIPDAAEDERHYRGVEDKTRITLRSLLTVPLWIKNKVIGVLQVGAREPHRLGELDLKSVEPLAVAAATAIENARLYERAWQVIDERFRMEEALSQAKEAADAANKARGEFLSRMSHEIRTPIHAIIGMTQLTLEAQPTVEQREYLEMVESSAEALLEIINEILDFSKIEAKRLELEEAPFEFRPVLERAADVIALRAHQKGLELICDISPDVAPALIGDARRLQQIFVNLLGNAVKFTEQGEILVQVEVEGESDNQVNLHCIVSDTGIGITREQQALVFDAFHQADGSSSRRFGGTGLGLAISKQLVELMGGRIWVKSQPSAGSAFHFVLPLARADSVPLGPLREPDIRDLRAWVVDENASSRRVLRRILDQWGIEVNEFKSGAVALEEFVRLNGSRRGDDIMLIDKGMPEMDGFALAEQMLAHGAPRESIVMMLTCENLPNDAARCRELGISRYLVKPVRPSELTRMVRPSEASRSKTDGRDEHPTVSRGPRLRILLAEDNMASQLIAKKGLEKAGHSVTLADNGVQVLAALKENTFDMILMDVEMPEIDGLEATRLIRQGELQTGRHQSIVAVTAYALKEDQDRCLAAGMDAYLSKPVTPEKMLSVLGRFQPTVSESNSNSVVDWDAALETVGGDRALLREAVELFLATDYPRQLEQLRDGIARQDADAVKKAAHGLKGTLDSFGSRGARDLAKEMETMGRAGKIGQAPAALEQFKAQVQLFVDYYAHSTGE